MARMGHRGDDFKQCDSSIDRQAAFDHDRLMGNDDAIWAFVARAEPERHREAGRSLAASR